MNQMELGVWIDMEIILIRHGKPCAATHKKMSATDFQLWIDTYNRSLVAPDSCPPPDLVKTLAHHFIISSDLPRALHSAELCTGKKPDLVLDKLKEMDVPCYPMPLKLSSYYWIILNGLLWLLGLSGKVDSFQHGKLRAKFAAQTLLKIAKQQGKVVVFGHKITNLLIAMELLKQGWKGKKNGRRYWSSMVMTD